MVETLGRFATKLPAVHAAKGLHEVGVDVVSKLKGARIGSQWASQRRETSATSLWKSETNSAILEFASSASVVCQLSVTSQRRRRRSHWARGLCLVGQEQEQAERVTATGRAHVLPAFPAATPLPSN